MNKLKISNKISKDVRNDLLTKISDCEVKNVIDNARFGRDCFRPRKEVK